MSSKGPTRVTAEYVWVYDNRLYSKSRTLEIRSLDEIEVENIKKWSYKFGDKEVELVPVNVFNCPFRGQNGIIVFCNNVNKSKKMDGPYTASQEYYIINTTSMLPYGFPSQIKPNLENEYRCSIGMERVYGRKIADLHYKLCLSAGVKITEIMNSDRPSKWLFKVEAGSKNDLCVHLWMARYILHRVGESCNVIMDMDPNLNKEYWNDCHLRIVGLEEEKVYENKVDLFSEKF